jgi:alpha-L-fucosidase fucA
LIEVRQEESKEIRKEVDVFVEVEARDQITEVGTKEVEESPIIPEVPLPTSPSEDSQETKPLLPPEDKKESGISRLLTPTALKETPLSPVVEAVTPDPVPSQEKLPQTGSEKASFLAWIGLLGLGFLGGRVKFARRKS